MSAERKGNNIDLNAPGVTPEAIFPEGGEADDDVEHNEILKNPRVQQKLFDFLELAAQSVIGSNTHLGFGFRF